MSAEETSGHDVMAEKPLEGTGVEGQDAGDPENLDRLLRQAAEYLKKGLLPEAKSQASKAIGARPANALAQNLMAMILFHQGRMNRAHEIFESLVKRNPEVLTLQINAGIAALHLDDLSCALTHFRAAVELDSSCTRAFGYLALVHLKLGELDLVRAALEEADLSAQADRFAGVTDNQAIAQLGCELEQDLERLMSSPPYLGKTPEPFEGFADVTQFSVYQPLPGSGEDAFIEQITSLAEQQTKAEEQITEGAAEDSPLPSILPHAQSVLPLASAKDPSEASPPQRSATDPSESSPPQRSTAIKDLDQAMEDAFIEEISSFAERINTTAGSGSSRETNAGSSAEDPSRPSRDLEPDHLPSPWAEYSNTESLGLETTRPLPLESAFAAPPLIKRLGDLALPIAENGPVVEHHAQLLLLRSQATQGGLLVRPSQMVMQQGELTWSQAYRLSKGVDAGLLEDQAGPLMQVQGAGIVAMYPGAGQQYELLQLEDEALFIQQTYLAGCSDQLHWENGSIPGLRRHGSAIIHLRGQGFLVLRHKGPLWSCTVSEEAPVRARLEWILGWTEAIVPQVLDHSTRMVGFEGQGVVWLTVGEASGP